VDQSRFQEAQSAYESGDFRTAAKVFLSSAGKGAAGNGSAYHMAGNSLMRLRRHQDAVTVYGHALRDETYDKRGAVQANLGTAYLAIGDYALAIKAYESALAEPDYTTPFRACQGMASALVERGRVDEAAAAYHRAAVDPANPEPAKALVNLGLCFMGLGRPQDAVEAYKAALGFDDYQGRGKALSNLGQAYVALGEYNEAIRAFEKATQLHGQRLSTSAQQAYDRAVLAATPAHEVVDGWETGEMVPVPQSMSGGGWDTDALAALSNDLPGVSEAAPVSGGDDAARAAAALGMGDDHDVNSFFSMTEDEMKQRDLAARRAARVERRSGPARIRRIAAGALVAVLLLVALGAVYWLGFGWPTQKTTVTGLFSAYSQGQPIETYWVAVPDKDIAREMAKIPPVKEFVVDDIDASSDASTVKVTVTPEKGAPLHYVVTLSREGVGWRVTGIENDWRSSGG
jgi:tetratricopeptide (TPR) repeat protein